MTKRTPHFNKGKLPVAFVFSVPGARELDENKPVAGDTGENLAFALEYLHSASPEMFPSIDRYAYRITNSFTEPLAKSLGNKATEAKRSEVLEGANVARVVRELRGCMVVVLCGRRAQLLSGAIQSSETTVVHAWHTGNRALAGKYKNKKVSATSSPRARRSARAELWAKEVLQSIAGHNAA